MIHSAFEVHDISHNLLEFDTPRLTNSVRICTQNTDTPISQNAFDPSILLLRAYHKVYDLPSYIDTNSQNNLHTAEIDIPYGIMDVLIDVALNIEVIRINGQQNCQPSPENIHCNNIIFSQISNPYDTAGVPTCNIQNNQIICEHDENDGIVLIGSKYYNSEAHCIPNSAQVLVEMKDTGEEIARYAVDSLQIQDALPDVVSHFPVMLLPEYNKTLIVKVTLDAQCNVQVPTVRVIAVTAYTFETGMDLLSLSPSRIFNISTDSGMPLTSDDDILLACRYLKNMESRGEAGTRLVWTGIVFDEMSLSWGVSSFPDQYRAFYPLFDISRRPFQEFGNLFQWDDTDVSFESSGKCAAFRHNDARLVKMNCSQTQ